MKDLFFKLALTIRAYSSDQDYQFKSHAYLPFRFLPILKERPFITTSVQYRVTTNLDKSNDLLVYKFDSQFRGKVITKAVLMDILNTCPVPIKCKYKKVNYYVGKGFICTCPDNPYEKPEILWTATIPSSMVNSDKDTLAPHIKFYVSKKLRTSEYRHIEVMVEELMSYMPDCDIIVTKDITDYITAKIKLPEFKTITDRKNYLENLKHECFKKVLAKVSPFVPS